MPEAPLATLALVLAVAAGCRGGGTECRVGADCTSGMCLGDGTCAPALGTDGGGGAEDAGRDPDAGQSRDAADDGAVDASGGDAALPGCRPDHDGIITREEVPLAAGLQATFRVATNATVDTVGTVQGDGSRAWDLSADLPGDHAALAEARPLTGLWFEDEFPGATYATRLSDSEDLLGVFQVTGDAVLLLGVVSPADGLDRTLLHYEPSVPVLQFPLESGASWATESDVSGTAFGVVSFFTEDYQHAVDARGELLTPFGRFPVLRVRTTLSRTVGLLGTTIRSFAFVTECFGTVATVTSSEDETTEEFSEAAEVRRLAP